MEQKATLTVSTPKVLYEKREKKRYKKITKGPKSCLSVGIVRKKRSSKNVFRSKHRHQKGL